jgi:hypothetical protein
MAESGCMVIGDLLHVVGLWHFYVLMQPTAAADIPLHEPTEASRKPLPTSKTLPCTMAEAAASYTL